MNISKKWLKEMEHEGKLIISDEDK